MPCSAGPPQQYIGTDSFSRRSVNAGGARYESEARRTGDSFATYLLSIRAMREGLAWLRNSMSTCRTNLCDTLRVRVSPFCALFGQASGRYLALAEGYLRISSAFRCLCTPCLVE
ncbi:hypothetical protein DIPPA_50223, partial [Diplonema papillatum]